MSILINSETIYLFKYFNDANEEKFRFIFRSIGQYNLYIFLCLASKIFMYILSNAISSKKLWILGVRFKGQLSAQFGCLRNCARIDGIEKKKNEEGNCKISVVYVLVIPRVT